MASVPVTILHGFLGSGKTTLLRSLLTQAYDTQQIPAVVVNDMSELDVDGVLVANSDVVGKHDGNFISISGESISSAAGVEKLHQALQQLCAGKPPAWIIIETSGSSHPLPLVRYFRDHENFELHGVLTLVDSTWIRDDYAAGFVRQWQQNLQQGERGIENLLAEQIMFSNHILLTKTDKLSAQEINNVAKELHTLNPYAAVIASSWGNITLPQVREIPAYNFFLVEQLITELASEVDAPLTLSGKSEQAIVSEVISDDRPFHPQRLWDACHRYLTRGVYRSKGFFWLPSRDGVSLLWNQAAGNIGLEVVGHWRAAVLEDKQHELLPEEARQLQQAIASVDSRFGDRRCRLTVIGQSDEVADFVQALQACFLSDDELMQWRRGDRFPDPWPQNIVEMD